MDAPYELESVKDYSDRIVCLSDEAIYILKLLVKDKTGFLFVNQSGEKLHAYHVDKRIRRIQRRDVALENKTIRSAHDCRRTYASIAYLHDVDIMTISN